MPLLLLPLSLPLMPPLVYPHTLAVILLLHKPRVLTPHLPSHLQLGAAPLASIFKPNTRLFCLCHCHHFCLLSCCFAAASASSYQPLLPRSYISRFCHVLISAAFAASSYQPLPPRPHISYFRRHLISPGYPGFLYQPLLPLPNISCFHRLTRRHTASLFELKVENKMKIQKARGKKAEKTI